MTPHKWPAIEILVSPKSYRAEQLEIGAAQLAMLVARESRKLAALKTLLKSAEDAQGDPDAFARDISRWKRGFALLSEAFSEAGSTDEMNELGEIASRAEPALGIASGDWVLVRGGTLTGSDREPVRRPLDYLSREIDEHGLVSSSAPFPRIDVSL